MTGRAAVVCGAGAWLPPRVVTNEELAATLDTSDEWIRTRTGIASRHVADPGTATSDLAVHAGALALRSAGLSGVDGVDAVVLATSTPDLLCPATAPTVAARLGFAGVAAWDVSAVCAGFVYGLASAVGLIVSGTAERVLLIGAEVFSRILDPADRSTAVIFGDGAGAVVLRAGHADEAGAVGPCVLGSDGNGQDLISIPAGGSRNRSSRDRADYCFRMNGRGVYQHAVARLTECSLAALHRAGWRTADVDRFAPHQANARITAAVAHRLDIDPARRLSNIDRVGNTAAASVPVLLADAAAGKRLDTGHRVLVAGFGGGLAWGAATFVWPELTAFAEYGIAQSSGEDMYEQLCQIIQTKFKVPAEEITPEATFGDLGLDSLDLAELALVVEKELGVRVSDDALAEAGRLDAVVEMIAGRDVVA